MGKCNHLDRNSFCGVSGTFDKLNSICSNKFFVTFSCQQLYRWIIITSVLNASFLLLYRSVKLTKLVTSKGDNIPTICQQSPIVFGTIVAHMKPALQICASCLPHYSNVNWAIFLHLHGISIVALCYIQRKDRSNKRFGTVIVGCQR